LEPGVGNRPGHEWWFLMEAPAQPSLASRTTLTQLKSFVVIGVISTLAYVVLYSLLRGVSSAPVANVLALLVTAVGNTTANRHLTFDVRGRAGLARDQVAGLVAFVVALAITSSSLGVLSVIAPKSPRAVEIVVLVGANGVATLSRFVLLRAL